MFFTDDTIVAIATPPGRGGIGVVRLSGPAAPAIAQELTGRPGRPFRPRYATLARFAPPASREAAGEATADQVICTAFPAPQSYTGDDVVEISAHGSPVVLARIVEEATRAGARLARPGEFTLRAYLNGRVDLVQAEAVADLVEAVTPAQARMAFDQLDGSLSGDIRALEQRVFELETRLEASLDFPDEGYHFVDRRTACDELRAIERSVRALLAGAQAGRMLRDGALAVIVGRPNAGKSSLFNALLGAPRAIVAATPGTTRDLLAERLDVAGVPVTLVDTAGLRAGGDDVEREGVTRARQAVGAAEVRLVVLDRSRALEAEDLALLDETASGPQVVVANKADLSAAWDAAALARARGIGIAEVSATIGSGLDVLRRGLADSLGVGPAVFGADPPRISNIRHVRLLEQAGAHLVEAAAAGEAGASEEFVLADLRAAREALGQVTGARQASAVLDEIFARFCIGK